MVLQSLNTEFEISSCREFPTRGMQPRVSPRSGQAGAGCDVPPVRANPDDCVLQIAGNS